MHQIWKIYRFNQPLFMKMHFLLIPLLAITLAGVGCQTSNKTSNECDENNPCSGDFICVDNQCEAVAECSEDTDCDQDHFCYKGNCEKKVSSVNDGGRGTKIIPGIADKTFESEHGDFTYTLTWSIDLLTLLNTSYPEASTHAPSFGVTNGGEITVATGWIDSPGYQMSSFINDTYYGGDRGKILTEEAKSTDAGMNNTVYFFTQPADWDTGCIVRYGVVKGLNEALSVRMEDCDGNDMKSSEAFNDLLSDLVITRK